MPSSETTLSIISPERTRGLGGDHPVALGGGAGSNVPSGEVVPGHDRGLDPHAVVGDRGEDRRGLHGVQRQSLAERDGGEVRRPPVLDVRQEPRALTRQVDATRLAHAELAQVVVERPLAELARP